MTMTVLEVKARLGPLLDQVSKGEELLIRRKNRVFRVVEVADTAAMPIRPPGYFSFDGELADLADRATPSHPERNDE
jgi:prevent-host-death family protein